jgi:ABC-type transport system involved in cytochrome bd biosynthesis fused ATPase/permease subunit
MKVTAAWFSCITAIVLPIIASLVLLYSDVQSIKVTKASNQDMMELKVQFTEQMTKNTSAIEALNETLKLIREELNEQ